jgi:epoxyqueuosine reductase
MLSAEARQCFQVEPAQFITEAIKTFARSSPANRLPDTGDPIFEEPLVRFASGDDPLFTEYKTIIAPDHLTPREALAKAYQKNPEVLPAKLSVISWILPIAAKTRQSNRRRKDMPSRPWSYTRWYGEHFNDALREYLVRLLTEMGYLAVAPAIQSFFKRSTSEQGELSNWSERHIAYAAGHGTFSLSDGFITERGIAQRCGSVVTDLELPASPRTAESPYSNCLFYSDGSCKACIARCPAEAITEAGHDKIKCQQYLYEDLGHLLKEYEVGVAGCGLCQVEVPCEAKNPVRKIKKKTN